MKQLSIVIRSIVLAGALALTGPAVAAENWYATADAGIGFLGNQNLTFRDGVITETAEAEFDTSFAGGGTVGYKFSNDWRVEGEIMYRRNELSAFTTPTLGTFSDGDFASLSFGASALYDFDLFGSSNVRSYAGAGIVFLQEVDIDFDQAGVETSFETDDIGFQVQFGARYKLSEKLFLDAGVRYLTATGIKMEFPTDAARTVESDYDPLTLTVGLGWSW